MKITDVKLSAPWYVRGKESTDATVVNLQFDLLRS
jgi:hypothetical protein